MPSQSSAAGPLDRPLPSATAKDDPTATQHVSTVVEEIAALKKLTVRGLRERYLEVFGEETRSSNKTYLFKRIAYRLQEIRYGGLSERALKRAEELAKDAPIRRGRLPPVQETPKPARRSDPRLPTVGTVLTRTRDGVEHKVTVLAEGFEYKGTRYRSLSAVANQITGTSWNGFAFFGLRGAQKEAQ